MNFAKQLIALAVVAAAFSAHAESDINTGAAAGLSATARLDFRITVPRIIYLQVGTGTPFTDVTTVDRVDFTLAAGDVGSGASIAGSSSITARVLGNGGNVSLSANGVAGGLTNGVQTIPWAQISSSSSNAGLPHPAIGNGVSGAVSTLTAVSGVVNQTATWSFGYNNFVPVAAGQYNGRVTYTAALP